MDDRFPSGRLCNTDMAFWVMIKLAVDGQERPVQIIMGGQISCWIG